MRAHQKLERRRAARQTEQRRREAEELAQREFERLRRESESRREPGPLPMPGTEQPPFDARSGSPLVWVMQWLNVIEDPWYRFAARLALIAGFLGLIFYALGSPARYPLFLIAVLLLGGFGWRRRRWDRWDRWDRWR